MRLLNDLHDIHASRELIDQRFESSSDCIKVLDLQTAGSTNPSPIDGNDLLTRIISAADATGLTAVRTPSQVLALVFLNAAPGTTRGGIFPNGVNGTINTV